MIESPAQGDTVVANLNTPFGFQQYRGTGSAPTYEIVTARIDAANNIPIFTGDPVSYRSPANGYIVESVAGTAPVLGIFVGCKFTSTVTKKTEWFNYWPGSGANGDVEAYVITDPNAQFVVQGGGAVIGQDKIGQNVQLNPGVGNTATGISGAFVENPAVTATLPFRIVGLVRNPPGANGTDITSPYNHVIVSFNNAITRANGGVPGIS
jgi:hypothetical protein